MKAIINITIFLLFTLFVVNNLFAQEDPKQKETKKKKVEMKTEKKNVTGFIDEDGDGYNDNAPDHDGDGIPNGLDPDYKQGDRRKGFVDLNGDGINDNAAFGRKKDLIRGKNKFGEIGKGKGNPQSGNVNGVGNSGSEDGRKRYQSSKGKKQGGQ